MSDASEREEDFDVWHTITGDKMLRMGLALAYPKLKPERRERWKEHTKLQRFSCHYGLGNPVAYAKIYMDLQRHGKMLEEECPKREKNLTHFLWAYNYLKRYQTEEQAAGDFGVCDKTASKYVWKMVFRVRDMMPYKIMMPAFLNPDLDPTKPQTIYCYGVDGVHCPIQERQTEEYFKDTTYWSHKTNSPGLAYEVASNIYEQEIVSVRGPYPAGTSDETIFKKPGGLRDQIPEGKKAVADGGYKRCGPKVSISTSLDDPRVARFKRRVKCCQETINGRMKKFAVLTTRFRHDDTKHQACFFAIAVTVQYTMENGSPLFVV